MPAYKLSLLLAELGLMDGPLQDTDSLTPTEAMQEMLDQLESRLQMVEPPPIEGRNPVLESDEIFFESPLLKAAELSGNPVFRSFQEYDDRTPGDAREEPPSEWETREFLDALEEEGKVYFDPIEPDTRDFAEELSLKELIHLHPHPMWLLDTESCLLAFNSAYEELLSSTLGILPVLGESVVQWSLFAQSLEENRRLYKRARDGERLKILHTFQSRGRTISLRFILQPLLSTENNQHKVLVITEDHTLCHEVSEQQEKLQRNFNSLLDVSDELIWGLDREMRFLFMNSHFQNSYLRRSYAKPVVGEKLRFELFPNEVAADWKEYYQRAFDGESFTIHRSREVRKQFFFFEYFFQPIFNSSSSVVGVCVKGRNLSSSEDILNNLRRKLKIKNNLK